MDKDYKIALLISEEELLALVKYHTRQITGVSRRLGKVSLDVALFKRIPNGRDLKMLHDVATQKVQEHANRARALASLLEEKGK